MKNKLFILLVSLPLLVFSGYCQDSTRTRNNKPGTPQSLRTPDQSPQSHVQIINPVNAPVQSIVEGAEGNKVNNTTQQTIVTDPANAGKPAPTNPITIANKPPGSMDSTVKNSAIQNGISNHTNPLRNK